MIEACGRGMQSGSSKDLERCWATSYSTGLIWRILWRSKRPVFLYRSFCLQETFFAGEELT